MPIADTLLKLIHDDDYSTGEASIFPRGRHKAYVDASKDGERCVVYAEDKYTAVVELENKYKINWFRRNIHVVNNL
ncbi:MAG: hypothetical protein GY869_12905 [Planctomycetes bacterium]|nr:hypothetical protein [Planctomycetota bacterium]